MLTVLDRVIDGEYEIVTYSTDGQTPSHIEKTLIGVVEEERATVEPEPTLEEKLAMIEGANFILMDALATVYEEVLMLRAELGGSRT